MGKQIDPKQYNLPARTVLEQVDEQTIAIIIDRKSRVIMADGRKISDKAAKIKQALPGTSVLVKTTAPVCSKTMRFLEDTGIKVTSLG